MDVPTAVDHPGTGKETYLGLWKEALGLWEPEPRFQVRRHQQRSMQDGSNLRIKEKEGQHGMTLGMAQTVDLKIVIDIFCLHYDPFSNLQAFNEVFFKTLTFVAMLWRKKKRERCQETHVQCYCRGEASLWEWRRSLEPGDWLQWQMQGNIHGIEALIEDSQKYLGRARSSGSHL